MTRFIAVSNRRGGVGKTTTTMMLAYGLSVLGFQRVLVIDLDAQASTSITMMGHERWSLARRDGHTLGDVLIEMHGTDKVDIRDRIASRVGDVHIMPGKRRPDIDLLPCTFELDNREREILMLGATAGPTVEHIFTGLQKRVAEILRSLDGHYDVVLMDCPPGLSNIAWGALHAADFVLVPYIPDATAQDNIGWFHQELCRQDPDRQIRVLANRVRGNNPFQAGIMDSVHDAYPSLGISMPVRTAIAGALDFRTNAEPLRSKFGDGAVVVESLFKAVLSWFEQSPVRSDWKLGNLSGLFHNANDNAHDSAHDSHLNEAQSYEAEPAEIGADHDLISLDDLAGEEHGLNQDNYDDHDGTDHDGYRGD